MGKSNAQILYFDWQGPDGTVTFGFSANELAGVDASCPFGTFPGLPSHVLGLVLWSGRLYPVIDLSPVFGPSYRAEIQRVLRMGRAVFLFSNEQEFAVALPSHPLVRESASGLLLSMRKLNKPAGEPHGEEAA